MALITRVSRLFRADLHAVLDQVEEPEILLRQAVREMEEELAREEQRLRVLSHEQAQLAGRQQDLEHSHKEIDEELDLCFESDKDDLARALVKRKLETERLHKILLRKHKDLEATLSRAQTRLAENRSRLENMRQKLDLLSGEEGANHADDNWSASDVSVREEDVDVAFLREKKRRTGS